MNKRGLAIAIVAALFILAACSPAATPTPTQAPQAVGGGNGAGTFGNLNEETRLAIGIFKLEGTGNAVTPAEAKLLLPLWQQIQTLDANGNPTQTEIQNVTDQMLVALNSTQVNAIDAMNLTAADIQSLMQQLNIQITPGAFGGGNGGNGGGGNGGTGTGFGGGNGGGGFGGGRNNGGTPFPTLSPDERSTRTAQRQTEVASGTQVPGFNGTPGAGFNGTPGAGGRFGAGGGFANMLVDPLIQLLQTRAGG